MTEITQNRLCWPAGWPRTPDAKRRMAAFQTSLSDAIIGIKKQVQLLGGSNLIISSDARRYRDGSLHLDQPYSIDPGIAVYFTVGDQRRVIPCDKWNRLQDNAQAVHRTLDALRGLDRWGTKQIVDAAFEGFRALPAPEPIEPSRPWWEVLGVAESADPVVVDAAYRALAKRTHPDRPGGDAAAFRSITAAYEAARLVTR